MNGAFPFFGGFVDAGYSAADAPARDLPIDFTRLLAPNPTATFLFRAEGEAMAGVGILAGDILVVDRSVKAARGKVIVAALDGEFLVRRLETNGARGNPVLVAENPDVAPIVVEEGRDFEAWGVVTGVVRLLEKGPGEGFRR